jgi:hypothetical protein
MRFSSSQIQSLFVVGDDDSDNDACCPGGRARVLAQAQEPLVCQKVELELFGR